MLLGKEPDVFSRNIERASLSRLYREREGYEAGNVPDPDALLRTDLEDARLDPVHGALADSLIEFLRREEVAVRQHGCHLAERPHRGHGQWAARQATRAQGQKAAIK